MQSPSTTRIARSPVRKRQAKFKIACAFRPLSPCGIPCGIFSTRRAPMGRFWIAARLRLSAFFSSACAREFFRPLPGAQCALAPPIFFPQDPSAKKLLRTPFQFGMRKNLSKSESALPIFNNSLKHSSTQKNFPKRHVFKTRIQTFQTFQTNTSNISNIARQNATPAHEIHFEERNIERMPSKSSEWEAADFMGTTWKVSKAQPASVFMRAKVIE